MSDQFEVNEEEEEEVGSEDEAASSSVNLPFLSIDLAGRGAWGLGAELGLQSRAQLQKELAKGRIPPNTHYTQP